jgi:hypothetical protein
VSLSQGDVFLSCPGSVDLGVLLPHLAGVIVEAVAAAAGLLLVTARARAPEAACPGCALPAPGSRHMKAAVVDRRAGPCPPTTVPVPPTIGLGHTKLALSFSHVAQALIVQSFADSYAVVVKHSSVRVEAA